MDTYELIVKRRTVRKFQQRPVPRELLERCVNAARVAPSGSNLQPLEYLVVADPEQCARVFPHTAWAGYLSDGTPGPGEQPTAYIFLLINTRVRPDAAMDVGIAAENIVLVALEGGVAGCMIGSLACDALRDVLGVPEHLEIALVVALGYPAEQPVMEEMAGDSVKYYRDDQGMLHVPKRPMSAVLHWNKY